MHALGDARRNVRASCKVRRAAMPRWQHADSRETPPIGTGAPVVFAVSTTGPSFTESKCSPHQVTWSVRPSCAKIDVNSLHGWAADGNVFNDDHSHGVRQLVTAPELLAPID